MLYLQVLAVDEIPLAYLPGGVVRLHMKVVGDLQIAHPCPKQHDPLKDPDLQQEESVQEQPQLPATPQQESCRLSVLENASTPSEPHHPEVTESYQPNTPETYQSDPSEPHHPDPSEPHCSHTSTAHHPQLPGPHHSDFSEPSHPDPSQTASLQPNSKTPAVQESQAAKRTQKKRPVSSVHQQCSTASLPPHSTSAVTPTAAPAGSPASGTTAPEAAVEADSPPHSLPGSSCTAGSRQASSEWVITKDHVEALAIGKACACVHTSVRPCVRP